MAQRSSAVDRPRGTLGKRRAILDGGLGIFARDGYARATVDAVAAAAGVSTRTIYNQFETKAALFRAVIEDSADAVAAVHVRVIQDCLGPVTRAEDVEPALVATGARLLASEGENAAHRALVRHVQADSAHIPAEILDSWQRRGPRRTRQELAGQLARLARLGLLRVADPDLASVHFVALAGTARQDPDPARSGPDTDALLRAAVDAFLRGHLPRG